MSRHDFIRSVAHIALFGHQSDIARTRLGGETQYNILIDTVGQDEVDALVADVMVEVASYIEQRDTAALCSALASIGERRSHITHDYVPEIHVHTGGSIGYRFGKDKIKAAHYVIQEAVHAGIVQEWSGESRMAHGFLRL